MGSTVAVGVTLGAGEGLAVSVAVGAGVLVGDSAGVGAFAVVVAGRTAWPVGAITGATPGSLEHAANALKSNSAQAARIVFWVKMNLRMSPGILNCNLLFWQGHTRINAPSA